MSESLDSIRRECQASLKRSLERRYDTNVRRKVVWWVVAVLILVVLAVLVAWIVIT